MRVLITGASGFLGVALTHALRGAGHEVIALCRSSRSSEQCISWKLGDAIPAFSKGHVDCAIHLAHDFDGYDGALRTATGTLGAVAQLAQRGVSRQLFFSSYSAGVHARSRYGKTKFEIERSLESFPGVIVIRPGLVLGGGGIYGRIEELVKRFPLVLLPDGGRGVVPVIEVKRLCAEVIRLVSTVDAPREANLFEPDSITLRELVQRAALRAGRSVWIVSMPARLLLGGFRLADFFRIPLPVNADNVEGFLANQSAAHSSSLEADHD